MVKCPHAIEREGRRLRFVVQCRECDGEPLLENGNWVDLRMIRG